MRNSERSRRVSIHIQPLRKSEMTVRKAVERQPHLSLWRTTEWIFVLLVGNIRPLEVDLFKLDCVGAKTTFVFYDNAGA